MTDALQYPTAEDVLAIHEDIVTSDSGTEPGVRTPESVGSALTYVSDGYFGRVPETIHEKAAHLMRLLAADHPFVDGNKRTALASVATFYAMNEYVFEYDDRVRTILKRFGTDESTVEMETIVEYHHENVRDSTVLHEGFRADSDAERREAIRRLAELDRERHADIYEKLARE